MLSLIHILAVCTVHWFAAELNKKISYKISENKIQFCSMVLLIFAFEYTTLSKTGLLVVQDSWQFSSAMWYGSSVPRVMGLLWLITVSYTHLDVYKRQHLIN